MAAYIQMPGQWVEVKNHKNIDPKDIMKAIVDYYDITKANIVYGRSYKHHAKCRHIFIYLTRMLTNLSLNEIASHVGHLDHTSIIYAVNKIAGYRDVYPEVDTDIKNLINKIK
jgi:chromosomal replication initiator protein